VGGIPLFHIILYPVLCFEFDYFKVWSVCAPCLLYYKLPLIVWL